MSARTSRNRNDDQDTPRDGREAQHRATAQPERSAYLATPYARRITGETMYVDAGVNIMA
jgi:enoyl-[acyl-carrier-protein] reductase (NADH)